MSTPAIRAALERLVEIDDANSINGADPDTTAWPDAIAAARAALAAEPEGEGPGIDDIRELCTDNELLMFLDSSDFDTVEVAILEIVRAALTRWGRPGVLAVLPPGYAEARQRLVKFLLLDLVAKLERHH